MRYLLDTHAFLWFVLDDQRISNEAKSIIEDSKNKIYFSAASAWEIAIKTKLARLKIEGEFESFIIEQLSTNSFVPLSISISHSLYTHRLPQVHKDPFDRIIIAQSALENLLLISKDREIRKYEIAMVW
ncbi:twitching motility protein PilT [Alkalispirochaeta odontotermitis]|nr:twitching motility protein PilT [Alkalispirochaeta odontotermitis]CAB1076338.1 Death on curing protein, Doc toxin [Olavius algarvensis Delta 1 endosymbiont]